MLQHINLGRAGDKIIFLDVAGENFSGFHMSFVEGLRKEGSFLGG